ncbi:protein tyrosine phosphatase [Brachybacterium huguangmaarense]|uniref:protein-tyrosine-phosphatase n=1 Tax=Brachybacterium huguangmaarense TaxID=1652028 RepID=A0ABY6G3L3_9MICO|nr:protein tyrosine phosphatase [Brachybacterium huguangmaarense]UYG17239.1 protein tyrosine phosphatase [Brachybacterium huguangmaarense]
MSDFRVLTVCTGNVCRSPAAAVMLRRGLRIAGLADRVEVQSGGTSWESEGSPMDDRTILALERAGYEKPFEHCARIIHQSEMSQWDLVLAMTAEHAETMRRKVDQIPEGTRRPEVFLWREFDPVAPTTAREEELAVKDPWYSGQKAFDRMVLHMERSVPSLVLYIRGRLREAAARSGGGATGAAEADSG